MAGVYDSSEASKQGIGNPLWHLVNDKSAPRPLKFYKSTTNFVLKKHLLLIIITMHCNKLSGTAVIDAKTLNKGTRGYAL
jgi:hypothetical protein